MPQTYRKAEHNIVANNGETFVIELEGNPTTGYEWQLEFEPDQLELVDEAIQPLSNNVGAAAAHRFELRAARPGKATVRALYKRRWETKAIDQQTFDVEVTE